MEEEAIQMEEGRSTIIVNLHEQHNPSSITNIINPTNTLNQKFESLNTAEKLNEKNKEAITANKKQPIKIQKASFLLKSDKNMKYFEPRAVPIGPLHHNQKPEFKYVEELKLRLTADFTKTYNLNRQNLYTNIHSHIHTLKSHYYEPDICQFNDEDLSWIFLVDGCSLIHYISMSENEIKKKDFNIKVDMECFASQDIFLLENQLPYQALQIIIQTIHDKKSQDDVYSKINQFIDNIASSIRGPKFVINKNNINTNPAHLLELLWIGLTGDPKSKNRKSTPQRQSQRQSQSPGPFHHSYRNVNELKAAGIDFGPEENGDLRKISFTKLPWFEKTGRFCLPIWLFKLGTKRRLMVPKLVLDDSTEPKLLNLIALEMCPDFHNDFPVSSYVSFLDSLIDHADDVKELRKRHVLYNALGSDENVACLFNEIGTDVVPDTALYSDVKNEIQNHCDKWCSTIMTEFFYTHFRTPWTILAFVGVLLGLALTFISTFSDFLFPKKGN